MNGEIYGGKSKEEKKRGREEERGGALLKKIAHSLCPHIISTMAQTEAKPDPAKQLMIKTKACQRCVAGGSFA